MKRVKQLHVASTVMANLAEEILEETGSYSDSFLSALAEAEADMKAGRVYSIESLDDLLKKPSDNA